jgi:hypothetical protein
MTTAKNENTTMTSGSYMALRHGGEPAWKAQQLLGLGGGEAATLEASFQARPVGRSASGRREPSRPAFAHHERHLTAVNAAGGFPVLPGVIR